MFTGGLAGLPSTRIEAVPVLVRTAVTVFALVRL